MRPQSGILINAMAVMLRSWQSDYVRSATWSSGHGLDEESWDPKPRRTDQVCYDIVQIFSLCYSARAVYLNMQPS